MLWFPTISKSGFRSIIGDTDETSRGKWLVPIQLLDIGKIWEDLEDAAVEGKLLAIKSRQSYCVEKWATISYAFIAGRQMQRQ